MKNKFEALEKKLGIATELIDELKITPVEILPEPLEVSLPAVIEEKEDFKVFELENLKADFMMLRQNVMKLVATGQRILDTASVVDVADMNANMLKSLGEIQNSLGSNLQLLINMYKTISEIENSRNKSYGKNKPQEPIAVNNGSVTNNNIVFSGSSSDLLKLINENK